MRSGSQKVSAILFLLIVGLLFAGCSRKAETLFELVPSSETGITFNNIVTDNDTFNILTEEYIYNGAGVAIGDFNNDSLPDIFFAGNTVANRLYINRGNFKFQDVSETANIARASTWSSGAVVVDINQDGWDDIYVTATMQKDSLLRANMLFVNKGKTSNGVPEFEEQAAKYGIDDKGYTTMASFFDYDLDGDLDLYVLTNQHLNHSPSDYRFKLMNGTSPNNDRLYRNNNDGTFTNVTREAGILYEGYGLGLAMNDFNDDGWPDIYVSNDFLSNDVLYLNNRNGTFTNATSAFIAHQSHSSMGNDAADYNNDGMTDIITLDMLPETNTRKKSTISNKSYVTYINNKKFSYDPQYVRNMLHLNNGVSAGIKFSEVGQLAGVHQTEWSWSAHFADFDNDGWKDLIITNGFPKDITDKDFSNYREDVERFVKIRSLLDSIPTVKVPNYSFKNMRNNTFSDVSAKWGIVHPSYSNGAAFADLDRDGDLDYVINNINDEAFVYRNNLSAGAGKDSVHYLRIALVGNAPNVHAVGAKVTLYANGQLQVFSNYTTRGYLSSVERIIHAGLGNVDRVDSLVVVWPNGEVQQMKDVPVNKVVTISQKDGLKRQLNMAQPAARIFDVSKAVLYKHEEEDRIDFNIQRTLPHKFSQSGPGIAVGDINNDNLEDIVIGGSYGKLTSVFLQQSNGQFKKQTVQGNISKVEEDEGLLLFDADNDGDLDLYAVSGSIEHEPGSQNYQDCLYKNDGKGNFSLDKMSLPELISSGSCVRGADIDSDGDIDLFVGARVIPARYPFAPRSFVLKNDNGRFSAMELTEEISSIGMVTDAVFTDFDNDQKADLVVVGEFMAVTFLKNTGSGFTVLKETGVEEYKGWWNSIAGGDFDNDGDIDYMIGNLGDNNNYQVNKEHPLRIVAKDFDMNGSVDAVLGCYINESPESPTKKMFPVHFWDELNSQSPRFRNQFRRYKQYGRTTLDGLFKPEDLQGALTLESNYFASSYCENLGGGKFRLTPLPIAVQVGPVNGIVVDDINGDGNVDAILIGNDYGNEVFAGRFDALTGITLLNDGRGKFSVLPSRQSGLYVPGDAKAFAKLSMQDKDLYVATQNQDSVCVFSVTRNAPLFNPLQTDVCADVILTDGRERKVEFYYGAGYLSQSSRRLRWMPDIKEIRVRNIKQEVRTIVNPGRQTAIR